MKGIIGIIGRALMSTAIVLVVIFILNKISFTKTFVQMALKG